jgi:hypothetical protein
MNESTPDHDAWQPCPPGEIGRMVGQLNTQRRRQQIKQFGVGVAALVLLAAVVIAGRGLLTRPSPSGPLYGGIACSQVMPLMQAYHDGTLAPGLTKKVRIHLEQCPNCGAKYRQLYAHAAVAGPTWRKPTPDGYRPAWGRHRFLVGQRHFRQGVLHKS